MDQRDRKIKQLENQLKELNELFIKTEVELRKKIRDIRISNLAATCAIEFTLAARLGVTMDVVLSLIPAEQKAAIEAVIDARMKQLPDAADMAMKIAAKRYLDEGEYGE